MTKARTSFDWNRQFQLAIDGGKKARERFGKAHGKSKADMDHCSMCGADFCAMRISQKIITDKKSRMKDFSPARRIR